MKHISIWRIWIIQWRNILQMTNAWCYKIMHGRRATQSIFQTFYSVTNILSCYNRNQCFVLLKRFQILHCNWPLKNYHLLSLGVISKNMNNVSERVLLTPPISNYTSLWGQIIFIYFNQETYCKRLNEEADMRIFYWAKLWRDLQKM